MHPGREFYHRRILHFSFSCVTMDSTASFKERALRLGLPEAAINRLVDSKLATFGQFAFISSFQPGSADEAFGGGNHKDPHGSP